MCKFATLYHISYMCAYVGGCACTRKRRLGKARFEHFPYVRASLEKRLGFLSNTCTKSIVFKEERRFDSKLNRYLKFFYGVLLFVGLNNTLGTYIES